jgi:ElaB/YqjD/DUF883 family membrane-anchored ribosome-binding protein
MNASSEQMNDQARSGSGEMRRFFADVEDLLKRVANMKDEDVSRLRERVEGSLGTARDAVSRNADRVRETAGEMADTTDEYVRRRPWTVAGAAMVFGVIVGALLLTASRR